MPIWEAISFGHTMPILLGVEVAEAPQVLTTMGVHDTSVCQLSEAQRVGIQLAQLGLDLTRGP